MSEVQTNFLAACDALRSWALALPPQHGEWEVNYPDWDALYSATRDLLRDSPSALPAPVTASLLYVLARDNEAEHVKELLEATPALLVTLAANAAAAEPQARWQLADALKTVNTQRSLDLLRGFATDADEYVRRRALLAMAAVKHPDTEHFALRAWDTQEPYSRIAAMHALATVGSQRLRAILEEAAVDSNEHVRSNAEQLSSAAGLTAARQTHPRVPDRVLAKIRARWGDQHTPAPPGLAAEHIHTDMGTSYFLSSDGHVFGQDFLDDSQPLVEIHPPLKWVALVAGSRTSQCLELLDLLPERPTMAVDCDPCKGSRWMELGKDVATGNPGRVVCFHCSGLGWKLGPVGPLASQIEARIDEYLASTDERLEWVRAAVRRFRFLPLYLGWVSTLGIRCDGTTVRWDHEDDPDRLSDLDDPFLRRMTLALGARSYPELKNMIPPRPDAAVTCDSCDGTGDIPQAPQIVCKCGGVGWLVPGETPGRSPG